MSLFRVGVRRSLTIKPASVSTGNIRPTEQRVLGKDIKIGANEAPEGFTL